MNGPIAQGGQPGQRKRGTRVLFVAVLVLVVLVGAVAGVWWIAKLRASHARAQWKEQAVERLAALSVTNEEVRGELEQLKAAAPGSADFRWTQDHVLLMTNGQYIIYASRHGANSGFVDHLFLGRGSDGRWLYSTYHFCNSMCGVLGEDPPGSITEFEKRFFAREFDGKSDECLQHTWPVKE